MSRKSGDRGVARIGLKHEGHEVVKRPGNEDPSHNSRLTTYSSPFNITSIHFAFSGALTACGTSAGMMMAAPEESS